MRTWLHLDLTHGASADMLAAALAGIGAPLDVGEEALRAVGFGRPRLELQDATRTGWRVCRVALSVDGSPFWTAPTPALGGSAPRPRQASRRAPSCERIVQGWRTGGACAPDDLLEVLDRADLVPVARALASRGARLALDALRTSAVPGLVDGVSLARLLCGLVVNAAFLAALDPAGVTTSYVGVSSGAVGPEEHLSGMVPPAPSPWLRALLAGVPVVEHAVSSVLADVAGVAVVRAIAPRVGWRVATSPSREALGVGSAEVPGRFVGVRAWLGEPAPVASREGDGEASVSVCIEAVLPEGFDRHGLWAQLGSMPTSLSGMAVERAHVDGASQHRLRFVVAPDDLDRATLALWSAGAAAVAWQWVQHRRAPVVHVTVPVGKGRRSVDIRVSVLEDGGSVLRVDPHPEDVRVAAERLNLHPHAVAAEAVASWQRLRSGRSSAAASGGKQPAGTSAGRRAHVDAAAPSSPAAGDAGGADKRRGTGMSEKSTRRHRG